jgi:hypothetical protein
MTMAKQQIQSSADGEMLSKILVSAAKESDKVMETYAGREEEIDELEQEVINEYINSSDLRLPSTPDHIQIQVVLAATQRKLSRVTEIYTGAIRNVTKQKAVQNMLFNAILPLVPGTSSEIRNAKTNDYTQGINYIIQLEEGLITICETAMKNLKTAQEIASRQLKAFELDLTYFDGASTFKAIVEASKKRYLNNDKS